MKNELRLNQNNMFKINISFFAEKLKLLLVVPSQIFSTFCIIKLQFCDFLRIKKPSMPCIVVTRKIQCRGHLNFAFHKVSREFQKNSHHWSINKVKVLKKWVQK